MNQNNNIKQYNRTICLKINLDLNNKRICIFFIGFNAYLKGNMEYLPEIKHIFKNDMVKQLIFLPVLIDIKFYVIIAIQYRN